MRSYGQLINEAICLNEKERASLNSPVKAVLGADYGPVNLSQLERCFNFPALPFELQLLVVEYLDFVELKLFECVDWRTPGLA